MAGEFKLIQVDAADEEELVIHAGGGVPATAASSKLVEDAAPAESADEQQDATADEQPKPDPAHERLRKRAAELEDAESNLRKTKVSKMQLYVLGALALLMVGFFAYALFVH